MAQFERGGLVEEVVCRRFAQDGEWPKWFLKSCGGVVPKHMVERGNRERLLLDAERRLAV